MSSPREDFAGGNCPAVHGTSQPVSNHKCALFVKCMHDLPCLGALGCSHWQSAGTPCRAPKPGGGPPPESQCCATLLCDRGGGSLEVTQGHHIVCVTGSKAHQKAAAKGIRQAGVARTSVHSTGKATAYRSSRWYTPTEQNGTNMDAGTWATRVKGTAAAMRCCTTVRRQARLRCQAWQN